MNNGDNDLEVSRIPSNFYELELRNPKRNTGFAYLGKNLLTQNPNRNIPKLELEEKMLKQDQSDKKRELDIYQRLLKGMGMKVHPHLVNKHAFAAKASPTDTGHYPEENNNEILDYEIQQNQKRNPNINFPDENYTEDAKSIISNIDQRNFNRSKIQNDENRGVTISPDIDHRAENSSRITIEKVLDKPRIDSAMTNRSYNKKPIDKFQE